jgi:hypothetical protein
MKTQIAQRRLDDEGEPIVGWSADKLPDYPYLKLVLEELAKLEPSDSEPTEVAEMGADYNDEEEDALSIVWANYPYFTDGDGSLRDMLAWVAVDRAKGHYYGTNLDGEEWHIPIADPLAAAKKMLESELI